MEQKKESIDYGVIIARKDGTFVVDNYHVCPASIDPNGKYNFDDVKTYAAANPDKVTSEPEPPRPTPEQIAEEKRRATVAELETLDRIVPRSIEDLYTALKMKPHEKVQKAIERKDELRKAL